MLLHAFIVSVLGEHQWEKQTHCSLLTCDSWCMPVVLYCTFGHPQMWCTYCTICGCYMADATRNCWHFGAHSVHIMQPCTREPCTFVLEDLAPLSPVLSSWGLHLSSLCWDSVSGDRTMYLCAVGLRPHLLSLCWDSVSGDRTTYLCAGGLSATVTSAIILRPTFIVSVPGQCQWGQNHVPLYWRA